MPPRQQQHVHRIECDLEGIQVTKVPSKAGHPRTQCLVAQQNRNLLTRPYYGYSAGVA